MLQNDRHSRTYTYSRAMSSIARLIMFRATLATLCAPRHLGLSLMFGTFVYVCSGKEALTYGAFSNLETASVVVCTAIASEGRVNHS